MSGTVNTITVSPVTAAGIAPSDVVLVRSSVIVTPTEADVFAIVRSYLLQYLASNVPVVHGQDNRVAEPLEDDWVELVSALHTRLATNSTTYVDPAVGMTVGPFPAGTKQVLQQTQLDIRIDVHGTNSAENANIISTLFRDSDACDFFASINPAVQPLYTSEPRQTPFVNEAQQYEDRWTVDVSVQANITTILPQLFAASAKFTLYKEP